MRAAAPKEVGFGYAISLLLAMLLTGSVVTRAERLPVKIYTTADGLAHNNVNRIVRDSRGFLWFCTFEGLSRFDGYTFTTYGVDDGLPSPVVNDLLETREGEYWVATGAGLCRFNPRGRAERRRTNAEQSAVANAMFAVYFPGEDAGSKDVTSLLQGTAGTIWCGTKKGLYRLEERDRQVAITRIELGMPTEPEGEYVTAMMEDRHGVLWIGSVSGIYRLFPDKHSEHYFSGLGLAKGINWNSLFEDREGRIWAGISETGLCRLVSDPDPARPVVARLYGEKDGLPTTWINEIFQASDGTLWAGSMIGLIRFTPTTDGRDFQFRTYAQSHGLPYPEVQSLVEDRNRNLWLGMKDAGGAIKLARSGITAFTETDGFKWASTIFKDRTGDLFVIGSPTMNGLGVRAYLVNRYDKERFTSIQLSLPKGVGMTWGWNQLMLEDRLGEWWLATSNGICRFPKVGFEQLGRTRPKAVYTMRDGLAGNVILRLFEDSRGDIWIGTVGESGLSRWKRATETFHKYSGKDGLPFPDYPISFCEDRAGAVWIGFSIGGGLVRYRDGRFTRFTQADGVPDGGIFNLFLDSQGRLWVPTTRGGVCRIDNPEADHPAFFTYTTADGLSSNSVRSVTEDRWGRIYLGTGHGIDRLDTATRHIKHYTAADGVLPSETGAAMQDRDGALWFGFYTGLIRFVPEPDQPPLPPPILITGLRIAGDAQPISALGETEIAPVELDADKNQLQIDFVALGFSPGEGLRYQYKLEGANDEWSPLSEHRTVNFANLAPGRYRFLARAVNADGAMSETPGTFLFTILPPIWQRWWFISIVAVLVGFAAYTLYQYRLARVIELERVRTRIATDLHDDIGSSLSQVSVLSEVIRRRIGQEANVSEPLSMIARLSRDVVDSMNDIVWAINPARDHLSDLIYRMRRFASDVYTARDLEFTFRAPDERLDMKMGADMRREVFLILKESVNNSVRHSGCSRADVEFRVENGWLELKVSDNGSGFDHNQVGDGNGLVSMRQRAEKIGGALQIVSNNGDGTTIKLRAPLGGRSHFWNGLKRPL